MLGISAPSPTEAARVLQPRSRFKALSQDEGKITQEFPVFLPHQRMPELIRSPCVMLEPALLTVGPSFPRLAGGFPQHTGCRLHPSEARDAP